MPWTEGEVESEVKGGHCIPGTYSLLEGGRTFKELQVVEGRMK